MRKFKFSLFTFQILKEKVKSWISKEKQRQSNAFFSEHFIGHNPLLYSVIGSQITLFTHFQPYLSSHSPLSYALALYSWGRPTDGHTNQGWTIPALLYCNTILEGQYCIGIAVFKKLRNTEYWAILANIEQYWAMPDNKIYELQENIRIYVIRRKIRN